MKRPPDLLRLIVPDAHGNHVNKAAWGAMIADAKRDKPKECVILGDFMDCGAFKRHPSSYAVENREDCYEDDAEAANGMLDDLQSVVDGPIHFIEGNHEVFVERWVIGKLPNQRDVEAFVGRYSPAARMRLKERGIRYYRRDRNHMGIATHGTIRLGKCFFTHGISAAKFATFIHLDRFASNVVHGHTHRMQMGGSRNLQCDNMIAYCPGTLADLQPLYAHTMPSQWTHGYGVQVVSRSGLFETIHRPIYKGQSVHGLMRRAA